MHIKSSPLLDARQTSSRSRRDSARPGQVGEAGDFSPARRLARELESIGVSLALAEQAAFACRATRNQKTSKADSDVDSRREELDRREQELQDRERAMDRFRMLLDQSQEKLTRGKGSLKRAILKFRAQSSQRTDDLDARERRLAAQHAELLETRREVAREQIRLKAIARESFQDMPSGSSPDTSSPHSPVSIGTP